MKQMRNYIGSKFHVIRLCCSQDMLTNKKSHLCLCVYVCERERERERGVFKIKKKQTLSTLKNLASE